MGFKYYEINFPSSDGKNTVHADVYEPSGEIFGVIQISHGMVDHVGRYNELAAFFAERGFVVAGNDHLGHGKTASSPEELGYFAESDGVSLVLSDLNAMNTELHERYPEKPVIMLGHSMGSFLARLYAVRYAESISALIIHGTGGGNPLVSLGKLVAKLNILFCGEKNRSRLLKKLSVGSYNKKFPKQEGHNAWLSRDVEKIMPKDKDELASFVFTSRAYYDLFTMLGESNSKEWYKAYPQNMKTLVVSGDMDPVGNFGKGVREVYNKLLASGCKDVTLKLYEGARHELFNELNRDEVFSDLLSFVREATVK